MDTCRHGYVVTSVFLEQPQTALFEFPFPLLGCGSGGGGGPLLLDHHHAELSFQQIDFSLRQLLSAPIKTIHYNK